LLSITNPPASPWLQQLPAPFPVQQANGWPAAVQAPVQAGSWSQVQVAVGRLLGEQVPFATSRMMPWPSVSPAHSQPPFAALQSRLTHLLLWQSALAPQAQP